MARITGPFRWVRLSGHQSLGRARTLVRDVKYARTDEERDKALEKLEKVVEGLHEKARTQERD